MLLFQYKDCVYLSYKNIYNLQVEWMLVLQGYCEIDLMKEKKSLGKLRNNLGKNEGKITKTTVGEWE